MTITEAGPLPGRDVSPKPDREVTFPDSAPLITGADPEIRDVLLPLGPRIRATDGVDTVLRLLAHPDIDYVTVTDIDDAPLGLITDVDIDQLQCEHPDHWADMRCGNVIVAPARYLHPDDSFDVAATILKEDGVRPLLVLDEHDMVGVLEPTTVFQWCAEHRPAALEELAQLAGSAETPAN